MPSTDDSFKFDVAIIGGGVIGCSTARIRARWGEPTMSRNGHPL